MSSLDADAYRVNIKDITSFCRDKSPEERRASLGMLALATGVHVVIVAVYLGELYGFTPELLNQIERLKTFYRIDQVLNINEPLTS